jgi:hypothetical protein
MDDGRKRIIRLVGDGVDKMSGGGIPLPDAFAAVLRHLLDAGEKATPEMLMKKITDEKKVKLKEKRIIAIWGSWESFTDDIITQLGVKGLLKSSSLWNEGNAWFWELGPKFAEGESLEVISEKEVTDATEGRVQISYSVTILNENTRTERDEIADLTLALGEYRAKVMRSGRMTDRIGYHMSRIVTELEGKRRTTAGYPPEPEDEPDVMVICQGLNKFGEEVGCGKSFAKTRQNFDIYPSRGQWYWRGVCIDCRLPLKTREAHERYLRIAWELIEKNGGDTLGISNSDMAIALGQKASGGSIGDTWDNLAKRGKLPPRRFVRSKPRG